MQKVKLIKTNLGIIVGSTVSYIDAVDSILRLIVTIGTIITIILTIEKLIRERKNKPTK